MASNTASHLTLWRSARVVSGFLVLLPFAGMALISIAISETYFPEDYRSGKFILGALIWLLPGLLLSAFVAFWRFRSAKVGKVASLVGVALFVALSVVAWLML